MTGIQGKSNQLPEVLHGADQLLQSSSGVRGDAASVSAQLQLLKSTTTTHWPHDSSPLAQKTTITSMRKPTADGHFHLALVFARSSRSSRPRHRCTASTMFQQNGYWPEVRMASAQVDSLCVRTPHRTILLENVGHRVYRPLKAEAQICDRDASAAAGLGSTCTQLSFGGALVAGCRHDSLKRKSAELQTARQVDLGSSGRSCRPRIGEWHALLLHVESRSNGSTSLTEHSPVFAASAPLSEC